METTPAGPVDRTHAVQGAKPGKSVLGIRIRVPWWIYLLAVFEILGGLTGFGTMANALDEILVRTADRPVVAMASWLLWIVMFCLFLASIVAGLLLVARRLPGWRLSRLVQAAQVIQFHVLGVKFALACGAYALVGVDRNLLVTFRYELGSMADLWLGKEPAVVFVGINGVALILFGLLLSAPELLAGTGDRSRLPG